MDVNERVARCFEQCAGVLEQAALAEAAHFLRHDEYEIAFEGLVLELISADATPPAFDYGEWRALAESMGLNEDSVLDGEFWAKFERWGRSR